MKRVLLSAMLFVAAAAGGAPLAWQDSEFARVAETDGEFSRVEIGRASCRERVCLYV